MKLLPSGRILLAVTLIAVIAAVAAGLVVLGSPSAQRSRRLDRKRVADLQMMTLLIDNYASSNRRLPESSGELDGAAGSAARSFDPVTAQEYEYRPGTDNSYELCAVFERSSGARQGVWDHGAGRRCFQRQAKVDPR